jgi:hypothetical protein
MNFLFVVFRFGMPSHVVYCKMNVRIVALCCALWFGWIEIYRWKQCTRFIANFKFQKRDRKSQKRNTPIPIPKNEEWDRNPWVQLKGGNNISFLIIYFHCTFLLVLWFMEIYNTRNGFGVRIMLISYSETVVSLPFF